MTVINVVVAGGSGILGSRVVRALLAEGGYQVSVLSRTDSKNENLDRLSKQGAGIIAVDYCRYDDLVRALQGADILVCVLSHDAATKLQPALFRAAKEAGVRRVVPSDYVPDVAELQAATYENPADGDKPFSAIHEDDLARFIAVSLKDPHSKNASFGFESCAITFLQLTAAVERHSGVALSVTHLLVDPSFSIAYSTADDVHAAYTFGHEVEMEVQGTSRIDNDRYPSVQTTSLDAYLADIFNK
ncbi:hypothetical protein THASP1DRAFT_28371 [Thamnocephalis sphaerospora]|uniref:NmrA-like domain-containing protein n=1 Tax=Thamnocephalis sphaerospora TaxID=78915 RepID=A0A4P9XV10_9FUNG|nr:hypothetical protein THASP1DRAFT_28371 [Thamnocephalis sphaerospora]|eukprot:RKP09822.1 hypothetical protein THASP1DRAFT_28371 [Thamnocephalis sphaerospora]